MEKDFDSSAAASEFCRGYTRSRISADSEGKPLYLNTITGQVVPEDGYFVHIGK